MLQALRLGRPLVEGFAGILAEAALFLAIVGLAWQPHSGRQCWKTGAPGEGVSGGKWVLFYKCIQLPPPLYRVYVLLL